MFFGWGLLTAFSLIKGAGPLRCLYLCVDTPPGKPHRSHSFPSRSLHMWNTGSQQEDRRRSARSCRRATPSYGHRSHNRTLQSTQELTADKRTKRAKCEAALSCLDLLRGQCYGSTCVPYFKIKVNTRNAFSFSL